MIALLCFVLAVLAAPFKSKSFAGELINSGAKVNITQIPYRGVAPALPDLMAGRLDLLPADPPVLLPLVQAKTVRPMVVFGGSVWSRFRIFRQRLSSAIPT
jgi:tripartite-type tricarboxylate transporter receptor subunit TctC